MAFINGNKILFSPVMQGVSDNAQTFYANGSDYAICMQWADGNPNLENRQNRFVELSEGGNKIAFARHDSDICGVTTDTAGYVENYGVYNDHSSLVGILGVVTIIDNGTCTVGQCCMSDDNGYAVPSTNNMGYRVMERLDATKIRIEVKPNDDMLQRVKTDVNIIKSDINEIKNKTPLTIDCDHEFEISGYTGHEEFASIPDVSEMHITKIQGHTGVKDGDATKTLVNSKCDFLSTGKNLLDISKYISKGGGQFDFDIHLPVGSYVLQNLDGSNLGVRTKNGDNIASSGWNTLLAFNVATEDDYTIVVSDSNHNERNILSKRIMLTYGTETYDFQPYTEKFVPFGVELGKWDYYQDGKIYRQTSEIITLNGTENWILDGNNKFYLKNVVVGYGHIPASEIASLVVNDSKYTVSSSYYGSQGLFSYMVWLGNSVNAPYYIEFKDSDVSSLSDWKAKLSANPIQFVYKLATPTVEEYPFVDGYKVVKGGLQQQVLLPCNGSTALPYTITKEYAVNIGSSISNTAKINASQSEKIADLQRQLDELKATLLNTYTIGNEK